MKLDKGSITANHTMRSVLIVAFTIISIVGILCVSLLNSYSTYQSTRTFLHSALSSTADNVAVKVDGYIGEVIASVKASAHSVSEQLYADEFSIRESALTSVLASHLGVRAIWSVESDGEIQSALSRFDILSPKLMANLWVPERDSTSQLSLISYSPVRFTRHSSEPLIDIAIPIAKSTHGGGRYVVATLTLKYLWDLLANLHLDRSQGAYAYTRSGTMIGHSNRALVFSPSSVPKDILTNYFENALLHTQEYLSNDQIEVISGFSLIERLDLGVVVEMPLSKAFQSAKIGIVNSLIVSVIAILISVFAGVLLARKLAHPIQMLSQTADKIATEELSSNVEVSGTLETQKLGQAFNQMVGRLSNTIRELKFQIESREKSEQALAESERRFHAVVEDLQEVFWFGSLDAQGALEILYINPAFEKIWGLKRESVHGNPNLWFNSIQQDDQARVKAAFYRFCRGEQDYNEIYTINRPDGGERTIRETGSLINDDEGNIYRIAGIQRDITDIVRTEEALRRSQKMDAIGQLTGGIAHDFNNILGIIQGNVELLSRQADFDDAAQKRINTIKGTTQRASDLTKQLLGFSRRQANTVVAVDLNRAIKEMESLISRSITPQVEIEHHLHKELWLTEVDPGDFQDALLNLILNAKDAMAGRGEITLETTNVSLDRDYCKTNPSARPGDYVLLTVSDTGHGIAPENLDNIYEPFFTTKDTGKGTGLGLAMVYGFVERSRGHLKVYSELNVGTTFRIYLPRFGGKVKSYEPTNMQVPQKPIGGSETILVVDDEVDLVELARESLEEMGYQVIIATSGQTALEKLSEEPGIQLLVSDVVMPGGMNGYELAEQAKDLYPRLKVLLTSGYTAKAAVRNGQAGFNSNLLSKPYSQIELAEHIRRVLDL